MHGDRGLTNDQLKIIAAVTMLIDHIGAYLLPSVAELRVIGRIAFPVFAFMIAEGCAHTKNKAKYLRNLFILAVFCQIVFYPFKPPTYMRIPVTFFIAATMVFALQNSKMRIFSNSSTASKALSVMLMTVLIWFVAFINQKLDIDYGFFGCMTPAMISVVYWQEGMPYKYKKRDTLNSKLLMLTVALLFISRNSSVIQYYSLFAVILLAMYNGKRENIVPKYFFYLFYPLHLAAIYAVQYLIK